MVTLIGVAGHPSHESIAAGSWSLEAEMLVGIAVALLVVWVLGVSGFFVVSDAVHLFLLAGLWCLLLAGVKTRDAAVRRRGRGDET